MNIETLGRLFERRADAHKYDFGHVLVVGGSPGMVGAPLLAGEAALRTGAGLVTIASRTDVIDKLEKRVREIMTLRLPTSRPAALRVLSTFIRDRKVSVLIVGPGQTKASAELSAGLMRVLDIPVVMDAGAFAAFSHNLGLLKELGERNGNLILTPHGGEFERLTGNKLPSNRVQLRHAAAQFSKFHNVTLVLKGHRTLVAHPEGKIFENSTGNPGMATAGTGDVLCGVIAGLLAQGLTTTEAAEAGVNLHGLAGDLAAQAKTQPGMIASDLIEQLPVALKSAAAVR